MPKFPPAAWIAVAAIALAGCGDGAPDAPAEADPPPDAPRTRGAETRPAPPESDARSRRPGESSTRPSTRESGRPADPAGPTTAHPPNSSTAPARPGDGEAATAPATRPATRRARFDEGLRAVRRLAAGLRFAEALDRAARLRSTFPDKAKGPELRALRARIREARRRAPQLRYALEQLGSDRVRRREVAAERIERAGDVGRLFLRHAVRASEPAVARRAVGILAKTPDSETATLFANRLENAEAGELRDALVAGLTRAAAHLPAETARRYARGLETSKGSQRRHRARILAAYFQKACDGSETRYDERIGPGSFEALRTTVKAAATARDPAVRAWARERSKQLGIMPPRALVLWLRPGEAEAEGGKIRRWPDASGRGHHAVQPEAARRPALVRPDSGPAFARLRERTHLAVRRLSYEGAGAIDAVTVMVWVRAKNPDNGARIVSWDRSEAYSLQWMGNGRLGWATTGPDGEIHDLWGKRSLRDGQWHHVVATFDAETGRKRIFVDGELDHAGKAHDGRGLGSGVRRFGFLGRNSEASAFNGEGHSGFEGDLAEVAVWHRALSEPEIRRLSELRAAGLK